MDAESTVAPARPVEAQFAPDVILPTQGMAIAALVASLVFWPVGFVLGFLALARIRKTGYQGRGMAITGLVLSSVGVVLWVLLVPVVLTLVTTLSTSVTESTAEVLPASTAPQPAAEATLTDTATPTPTLTPTPTPTVALRGEAIVPGTIDASVIVGQSGSTSGAIAFTVVGYQCGFVSVGTGPVAATARGQFCEVKLTVANTGDEPHRFTYLDATAYDGDQIFRADAAASLYADTAATFTEDIPVGGSVAATVYFDVPMNRTLDRLTLAQSAISGVVEVKL